MDLAGQLSITLSAPGAIVVHMPHIVDGANRDQLIAELVPIVSAEDTRRLTLDFADNTFVDSAGMSVLIQLRNAGRDAGFDVLLRDIAPQFERTLVITGLDDLFEYQVRAAE